MNVRQITAAVLVCMALAQVSWAQRTRTRATTPAASTPSPVAATPDMNLFKNLKARSIGPGTMSGRVTAIDAVWSNPDIIYAGTASGGVWKTENGGHTWTSVFDSAPILNIGSLAIQQSNPSVVWVGTGEGNPRNSLNLGAGIFKSLDGGKTWKAAGLEKTSNIHRILIDPTNPNVVYAGVIGNPFAAHPERGVFKTTDGGQTWEKVLFTNESSGVGDMVMDPTNPNKIIANMWEHKRTPYNFKSGGSGSGMYLTLDGGRNWKKLDDKNGLPKGELGRMGIAIAPSEPMIIYALIESKKNALYKSEDGGFNWKKINEEEDVANNRPFYFFDIAVDPKNENRVYNVYQMISMSEDGGKSFKVIVPYSGVHPDHHAFWIHPQDPSLIINGNDGGVAISRDRGRKWTFAESIPVGQFYHVNVDNAIPYNVYGGLQDNGSWRGPAYTWQTGGIRNQYWESVLFGDGFDVVPDPEDNRYGYAMSQGGNLARYDALTGNSEFIRPTHPDRNMRLRFNWNAAIAADPHNKAGLYYASQFVHKSGDKGNTWEIISPDLTTNNAEQQKESDNSGGLTIDLTSAENHNTILTIAPSTLDKNVLWVGTDDGNVQITRDGGKTWSEVSGRMAGLPDKAWIPQIQASRYAAGEAFVVANNYRNGEAFVPYVYRTRDYGLTWERLAQNVTGYALSVLQDPVEPNLLFVGTEQGLFVSFDGGGNFSRWAHGFPPVSTMDMTIQEREADLVIATFGRAIYVLDDIRPLRAVANAKGTITEKSIKAFPTPTAYLAETKEAPGVMFGGDAMYMGENRPMGGRLTYFARPAKNDKGEIKADTVQARFYNASGELIRTLQQKVDTVGFYRLNWGLNEKGRRYPGSKKPKKGDNEPGGWSVFPGTYKVVYQLGKDKDSTEIVVKPEPRAAYDQAAEQEKRSLLTRLNKSTDKLVTATDRLDEVQAITERVLAQLKDNDDKQLDSLRKATKTIQESIKATREIVMGKKPDRQGYGRPYQLTALGKIGEAGRYLQSKAKVTAAEKQLVTDAEEMTTEAIEKINQFFAGKWQSYQKLVEASPLSLFKSYEPIR